MVYDKNRNGLNLNNLEKDQELEPVICLLSGTNLSDKSWNRVSGLVSINSRGRANSCSNEQPLRVADGAMALTRIALLLIDLANSKSTIDSCVEVCS